MKLLHIDSSIMSDKSVTRVLTAEIVEQYKASEESLDVTYYDLDKKPFSHLSSTVFADEDEQFIGVRALDDFFAADVLVIGAPMYNFGIPSQLKAWVDRIAVSGKTFRYTAEGPEGLVKDKKVIIVSSRGGVYSGDLAFMDHQESYLKGVFGFLGVAPDDIQIIRAEGVNVSPEAAESAIATAKSQIAELV